MADGTTQSIAEVDVGDEVQATHATDGQPAPPGTQPEDVTQLQINQDHRLSDVTITDTDGYTSVIHTTQNHPFWDATTQHWTPAGDLQPGHTLQTNTGKHTTVTAIHNFGGSTHMYNLTVADLHTYYVIAGTTPVLVHNANCAGVGEYLAKKAPNQVAPGVRKIEGQYVNNLGRVEPWVAHYDEYGRMIGRTDYNAGNRAAGIPDTHYHRYEYGPGRNPAEVEAHVPGEFPR